MEQSLNIPYKRTIIELYLLDYTSKLLNFSYNILISTFYIFHICDECFASCDHSSNDHRHSGTEIPARYSRSSEMSFSKYESFMRVHDSNMSFHLFNFDKPIEPSFKKNFMNTRYSFSLREEEGKWGLEICRESWKDIRLKRNCTKTRTRIIYDDFIFFAFQIKSHSSFTTLLEKCRKVGNSSIFYYD